VLKNISIAFVFTFIGKLFAFLRVQQLAHNYGQEYWLDAFFIVFSFTSIFDTVLISGAIALTLIPSYLKEKSISIQKSEELYSNVFSVMFSVFVCLTATLFFYSREIAELLIRGEEGDLINAVEYLLKRFSAFPLLALVFQLPTIYNQANGNYQLSTLNPILLNGVQLIAILTVAFYGVNVKHDVLLFQYLYLLTMLVCFFTQVWFFRPALPKKLISFNFKSIKIFSISVIPFIFFISIEEINLLVDQYFASSLSEGSVSNLLFANRLVKIFGAIFVASIITVFYPKISSLIAKGRLKEARYVSHLILEILSIITISIVFVFYFFSKNIVDLVYGENVSHVVSEVLKVYSFLVFTSAIYVIQLRLIYSIGVSWKVVLLCTTIPIFNFVLNGIFIVHFELVGLALSTVLLSVYQVFLFDFYLRRKGIFLFSGKMVIRLFLHVVYIYGILKFFNGYFLLAGDWHWLYSVSLTLLVYFVSSFFVSKKQLVRLKKL